MLEIADGPWGNKIVVSSGTSKDRPAVAKCHEPKTWEHGTSHCVRKPIASSSLEPVHEFDIPILVVPTNKDHHFIWLPALYFWTRSRTTSENVAPVVHPYLWSAANPVVSWVPSTPLGAPGGTRAREPNMDDELNGFHPHISACSYSAALADLVSL